VTDTVTATLAEWEALANAATDGPWEAVGDGDPYEDGDPRLRWGDVTRGEPGNRFIVCESAGPDGEFIAASRTAMPALLAFVREVQHILATQRHEVIGARGLREQDVVRARDIEQAARKWIGGEG
jgi:hypothetical protein